MGDNKRDSNAASVLFSPFWWLLVAVLCIATCDDCAGARKNAVMFRRELIPLEKPPVCASPPAPEPEPEPKSPEPSPIEPLEPSPLDPDPFDK